MATTTKRKRISKADKAIRQLYVSVDKLIRAAEEAKTARDELIRLGQQKPKVEGCNND